MLNTWSEKEKKIMFILTTLLGLMFVIFFYEQKLGISYTIYIVSLLVYYYWAISIKSKISMTKYLVTAGYIFALATIYFRSDFYLFKVLNFLLIPILFGTHCTLHLEQKGESKNILYRIIYILIYPIGQLDKYFTKVFKLRILKNNEILKKVIIGIIIVLPVLLIILPLMTSADAVFAYNIGNFSDVISDMLDINILIKIGIVIVVAAYFFGQSYSTFIKNQVKKDEVIVESQKFKGFDTTITITFLVVLDIIYSAFSYIQFHYLFAGNNGNLPDGFTYAEYARSGFFQLVLLSIFNVMIILIVNKYYSGNNNWIKSLLSIMVFFSYIMIISSIYRMYLYESTYGYTRLRLLVYMFLIIEAILMILVAYTVWKKEFSLVKWGIYTVLIYYILTNFINIDGIIANKNINRYYETGKIDLYYLLSLSDDATEQLMRLSNIEDEMYTDHILYELKERKEKPKTDWQSFNLSNYKADQIYKKLY